jgi:methylenetetrahydrofolate reductase (NADPH)
MKIKDILKEKRTISFEFYPPKTSEGIPAVLRAIHELKVFRPDFISITYGAGGTTRVFTEEITVQVKRQAELEVMAHLTCAAQTKEEVHGVLMRLDQAGVENVIALRGDPPRGQSSFVPAQDGFSHATELIEHVRRYFQFGIAGACYPEGHPESPDLWTDIKYARLKADAGANFLITQLFYDNNDFFAFVDRAQEVGIDIPILAGVLPILNAAQIRRFTTLCGAKIPPALDKQLEKFADDDAAVRELGVEYATEQVRELWENGVAGIHFYVLNRSYSISQILRNLGLPGHPGSCA